MQRPFRPSETILMTVATILLAAGPAAAGGQIFGKALFEGPPPVRPKLDMTADPNCVKFNPDGRLDETVIVSSAGGLANVFVYIKDGLGDATFPKPATAVEIDQTGCMYHPRVIGAMVGQPIEIHNNDPTLHNVHSLPKKSRQFNSAMPLKGMTIKKRFAAPEVMVRIKCDVHAWMAAYVGVLKHPFFAVSGPDGTFKIKDVPPGTYTVEAWHETLGTRTGTVTVADDGSAEVDFTFKPTE